LQRQAETNATFVDQVSIAAMNSLRKGEMLTLAGTLDASGEHLTDATGSVPLSQDYSAWRRPCHPELVEGSASRPLHDSTSKSRVALPSTSSG
jgi:hypothetical protein